MKILFLDFDGVLNSVRSVIAFSRFPHELHDRDLAVFDQVAVGMIRRLCSDCNVRIVASTTWRIHFTPAAMAKALDLPIIDETPRLLGPRGLEINAWLAKHPEVGQYAIVDDNSDMLAEQRPCFVQTDMNEGLTHRNYLQLLALLA